MTTMTVRCPILDCDLQVQGWQITVDEPTPGTHMWSFWCTECRDRHTKPAADYTLRLLRLGGVTIQPPEATQHDGPTLTGDDLAAFTAALQALHPARAAAVDRHRVPSVGGGS